MAHASFWCHLAIICACKGTRAIQNVHDQPEPLRRLPATVNQLCPVEFMTISQPQILDAWHQWRNTGRVFVTRDFLGIFGRLFDCVPVRNLISDLHHQTQRKNNPTRSEIMILECSFPLIIPRQDFRSHDRGDLREGSVIESIIKWCIRSWYAPKTFGNRKRYCAWGWLRWPTLPEKLLQIAKHKSTRRHSFRPPDWFVLCDLQKFLRQCFSSQATSRTTSFAITGSAEALPILCVRYFRWEREIQRETDGSDVTIVALKLAMNLHFPLPKIRTFRFALHTSRLSIHGEAWRSPFWRWNSQWVHTFHCRIFFALFVPPLSNGTSRATSDRKPKTNDQILPSLILFFPSKNESN